jgi:hypothetical protein
MCAYSLYNKHFEAVCYSFLGKKIIFKIKSIASVCYKFTIFKKKIQNRINQKTSSNEKGLRVVSQKNRWD